MYFPTLCKEVNNFDSSCMSFLACGDVKTENDLLSITEKGSEESSQ